jgi:DNA replication and repair protein RecF
MDKNSLKTIIRSIELRNFRCFSDKKIMLDAPIVVIEGENGSGKTSLVEALYFVGHMRSCKTVYVDHLIKQNEQAFFLKVHTACNDTFYIGVEQKKKIVKINQKQLKSLKEVQSLLTIVGVIETDILLVQGGPLERRLFLDEALLLLNSDLTTLFKKLKTIVKHRNDFLQRGIQNETLYTVLTEQLVECSALVQKNRFELLTKLAFHINCLIKEYGVPMRPIDLTYAPKVDFTKAFFIDSLKSYEKQEYLYGRSLFGAHLDDFSIQWESMSARKHGSRGQQKILVMLLKVSLVKLCNSFSKEALLLVDDFITDFDHKNMEVMVKVLCSIQGQLIYTSPLASIFQQYIPSSFEKITLNL